MSYDIQIWSVEEPDFVEISKGLDGWDGSERFLTFQKSTWQILIGPCSLVEQEDIPTEIFQTLPGIRYLTEMNLEPIHAPQSARTRLLKMGRRIAKSSHGVEFDPQQDTITSPRGVKRVSRSKSEERISVLNLAWWFNESPLVEEGGLSRLLSIFEGYLPEALPRRYGQYEPPQFKYEIEGKEHFIELLLSERIGVVWYPHYPVLHVGLSITDGFGPTRQGYKTHYLSIRVDSSVWAQPGWGLGLRRFWFEMCDYIQPFFGEVRVLHNYILLRGRPYSDGKTDSHPIKNGWWNGIPRELGAAVVIDDRYAQLWRGFVKKSEPKNGLFHVWDNDWIDGKRVEQLVGRVPRGIAQGNYSVPVAGGGLRNTYPRKWPFEHPFVDD